MKLPGGSLPMIVPGLDPELAERLRLQLRVLDDRPPEGPGVRDDDADLHGAEDTSLGRNALFEMEELIRVVPPTYTR